MAPGVNQGYFSLIRWRSTPHRQEARNIAVMLVDAEGQFGGIRTAPPSAMSRSLKAQGIVDALLMNLRDQFASAEKPDLARLQKLHATLRHSLAVTEPQVTAVMDLDSTLGALYHAYVQPTSSGPRHVTKAVILDRVVERLRGQGLTVRRSSYLSDHIFDAIADGVRPSVFEILSFASPLKDWTPIEKDAGHFLYAMRQVDADPRAVIQPPPDEATDEARVSFDRIRRWLDQEKVPVLAPADLEAQSGFQLG